MQPESFGLKNIFRLNYEKEDFQTINENISKGVVFKWTNLWILIFAIFIASLGLNINSTAVIIGAMLISPLMWPIIGFGYAVGINDLSLIRRSLKHFSFAVIVGLATSTIYFSITPLSEAHSEIFARVSPNIYDVLIAFFGGLAGMVAICSKNKGNVIPGVAIATALMPPLCTAGYGIATGQWEFFLGAGYLFLINSVFITLASIFVTRLLRFPFIDFPDSDEKKRIRRRIWSVVIITILPSLYLAYDLIHQTTTTKTINTFIEEQWHIPNNYLLEKNINISAKTIVLTYGGQVITDAQKQEMIGSLKQYGLEKMHLEIRQGFSYTGKDDSLEKQLLQITQTVYQKDTLIQWLQEQVHIIEAKQELSQDIFTSAQDQYTLTSLILEPITIDENQDTWIAIVTTEASWDPEVIQSFDEWIKTKLGTDSVRIYFDVTPVVQDNSPVQARKENTSTTTL